MHGGVAKDQLQHENIEAVEAGLVNLERHVNNIKKYGVEPIVGFKCIYS